MEENQTTSWVSSSENITAAVRQHLIQKSVMTSPKEPEVPAI